MQVDLRRGVVSEQLSLKVVVSYTRLTVYLIYMKSLIFYERMLSINVFSSTLKSNLALWSLIFVKALSTTLIVAFVASLDQDWTLKGKSTSFSKCCFSKVQSSISNLVIFLFFK